MSQTVNYPFRVFANNNLGTEYDDTAFTGEWLSSKGSGQSSVLPDINLATGNSIVKSPVVKTQETIGDWEFGFVYNAQNINPWSYNIPEIVHANETQLIMSERDGSLVTYCWDAVYEAYVAPSGCTSKSLIRKRNDGTFLQSDPKTGKRNHYDSGGKITDVYDARGFSMHYGYDANNKLQTITSDAGVYTLSENNLVMGLSFVKTGETQSELLGSWTFDDNKRLQTATIPGVTPYDIQYIYNGTTNQLTNMTQTDGTAVNFTYTTDHPAKIKTLQQGSAGPYFNFKYDDNKTTITDALGFTKTATLDANNHIVTWNSQAGDTPDETTTLTTTCAYHQNGDLKNFIKPNLAKTQFVFNGLGQVIERIDPNGQTTQFDYDPNTFECIIKRELIGGTADNALWATTRYVYTESPIKVFHLRCRVLAFKISPQGAVTDYRYDDQGALNSERTYLQNFYPVATLSPETRLHYLDVKSWATAQLPNQITLSTFSDNNRGQRTAVQHFSEINPDGTGINSLAASDNQFQNHTLWGGVPIHTQKMDVDNNKNDIAATTIQTFDQLHRLTSHQNALNQARNVTYNDAAQNLVTTEPNGRTETTVWNSAGQITTTTTAIPSNSITRTKTNHYDLAGHVNAITDIDGQITYQLFDGLNRPRFTLSPMGLVCENFYDDVNRYSGKTNYYTKVLTSSFSISNPPTFDWLATNLIKDAIKDVTTFKVYDESKRLQFEIDGRGAVIEHRYDLRNNEILKIAYDAEITSDELNALKQGTLSRTPGALDCVHATFYDDDHHSIATQDPAGYITTFQRNPAGFLNKHYCYATPVSIILNNTVILPTTSTDDYFKYFYTDAKGQARVIVDGVDGANYVVEQEFYPTGHIFRETKFADQAPLQPTLAADPATLIPAENTEDQITIDQYDLLNRKTLEHLPEARFKTHAFDIMGNEIATSVGDDQEQSVGNVPMTKHTTAKQFNAWGECIREATPLLCAKIMAIQNNAALTPEEQAQQMNAVWENQSLRHIHDDKTGLYIAKIDIVPDDGDPTKPATTYYFCDYDRRIILTIGPEGQASTTEWHPVFQEALEKYRYATAVDTTGLTGGFMTDAVEDLLTKNPAKDSVDQYSYDNGGAAINHIDPEGYVTQTHLTMFGKWDTQNRSINSTTPTLQVARDYNLRQQLLTEIETANHKSITTVNKEYENLHGLCTSSTDGNGATTTVTHEPRGVLLTSTDALNRITVFAHDAFHRETKCVLPMQQSIEQIYTQIDRSVKTNHCDTTGAVISSTKDIHDAFGNVTAHRDAENNISSNTYNAANQLRTKIDPLGNQYEQEHDLRGLLRQTSFVQNNSAYKTTSALDYNLSRECNSKTEDVGGLNLQTQHHWNALSQRDQTITANGNTRGTVFNQRSLPTEQHKFLDAKTAVITAQSYNAQHQSNSVTHRTDAQIHHYQEQSVHDDFGRPEKTVVNPKNVDNPNGLALTTQKILDDANHVIAITDPKNQTTFIVRDRLGNIRFEINNKGGVTEHQYNNANKPIFTVQYEVAVDLTKVTVGMNTDAVKKLLTDSDYDRHTHYFYDDLFNERFRINRAGAVTETRYNKKCEKTASLAYYTAMTANPTTLTTAQLITQCALIRNTEKDRATYRILDANGQEVFIIHADGSVIQKCYYSTLHKANVEIKYDTIIADPEALAKLSPAQIAAQLTVSNEDRQTYWMVDGLGRLTFHVSPNGAVTGFHYDGDTHNRTQIIEFKKQITLPPANYAALQTQLNNIIPDPTVDNIETRHYDGAERFITRTNGLGKSESFGYDGASRKSSHTTLSGNQWTYDYDGASRLWHEFSPTTTVYAASIDAHNVTAITVTPNTVSVEKETSYDANGNVIGITSGVGLDDEHIVNFAYDALNLKNQDTWNNIPIDDPTQKTSLTIRPETTQSISKTVVQGAHGAKLVTLNEAGNPVFYAYNAEGQLRYRINANGYVIEYQRNSLGECEHFISYAAPLSIDLSQYIKTGLMPDIIEKNITKDSAHDRSFNQLFNQQGRVTQITRDPVVCYIPDPNPANAPTVAIQTPTKQHTYNTFGELIAVSDLVDETHTISRQTITWYDKNGRDIATVDANGIAKVLTFDAHGRQIEEYRYANKISPSQMPTPGTTFAALQALLAPLADTTRDHHTLTPRDVIGRIKGIYHVGVVTQQAVTGQQAFADNKPATLGVTYTYTDDHKIKTITYPDGQVKIRYYDERRYLIAEADVVRTQSDGTQIRPITYYHVSIHGERVETYMPAGGCAVHCDPDVLPTPISIPDKDRYHRFVRDGRQKILARQDPENNLKQTTYQATGKEARNYKPTTNPKSSAITPPTESVTHIDEKQKVYDALDNLTLITVCRDGETLYQTAYKHDAFNIVAEGPNDGTWPVTHHYDQADRKWFTTDSKGGQQLQGYTAAADHTLELESRTADFSTLAYADFPALLQQKYNDVRNYEFTQKILDAGGQVTAIVEPGYFDSDNQLQHAPKSVLISPLFPQFGNISLSFQAHIDPNRFPAQLTLTHKDTHQRVAMPMHYCEKTKRFGVDISRLEWGCYKVDIQHILKAQTQADQDELFPEYHWETDINWQRTQRSAQAEPESSILTLQHPEKLPENPALQVWIEQYGQEGVWKPVPLLKVNHQNNTVQFDTKDFPHDQYRYHLGGKNAYKNPYTFSLTSPGEQTYLAKSFAGDDTIVRPTHQMALSNFGELIETTTPNGEITKRQYNKIKKLSEKIDPETTVVDETGNATRTTSTTIFGYNNQGGKIGVCDPNGNTELITLDEANQPTAHTDGNGIPYYTDKTRTVFGDATQVTSASGNIWKTEHNSKGAVTTETDPSGNTWNYERNENGFITQKTPPTGSSTGVTQYAEAPCGKQSAQYPPMGGAIEDTYDRHGKSLTHTAIKPDGTTEYSTSKTRDYSGKETHSTNGMGAVMEITYHPNGVEKKKKEVTPAAGLSMRVFDYTINSFTQTTTETPPTELEFEYLTSKFLCKIIDKNTAMPQTFVQTRDLNGNRQSFQETNGAGNTLRESVFTYNPLQNTKTITTKSFSLTESYDPDGNVRRILAQYTAGGVTTHDGWWTYGKDRRVIVNDGVMGSNNVIAPLYVPGNWGYLPPSQGNQFSDTNGLRTGQSLFFGKYLGAISDLWPLSANYTYDPTDRVSGITANPIPQPSSGPLSNPQITVWSRDGALVWPMENYNGASVFCDQNIRVQCLAGNSYYQPNAFEDGQYRASFPIPACNTAIVTVSASYCGANSQTSILLTPCMGGADPYSYPETISYTPEGLFTAAALTQLQQSGQVLVNQCTYNGNGFLIYDFRKTVDGDTRVNYSSFTMDGLPLASTSAWQSNVNNSVYANDALSYTYFYFNKPQLNQVSATRTDQNGTSPTRDVYYFYDSNKRNNGASGVHCPTDNPDDPTSELGYDAYSVSSLLTFLVQDLVAEERELLLAECFALFNGNQNITYQPTLYYADGRGKVVATLGTVYGSYLNEIQATLTLMDPVETLNVSTIEQAPEQGLAAKQKINAYNQAGDVRPYSKMMESFYASLNPSLEMKQPKPPKPHHESFWDELIGAVVAVVIMCYAPELSAFMFDAVISGLTAIETAIGFAVAGALADAATQGIGIAFDDRHSFSMSEMFENAVVAGATAGLSKAFKVNELFEANTVTKDAEAFASVAAINTVVQGFGVLCGYQKKVDPKRVFEQASAALINARMSSETAKAPAVVRHGVDELENTAVGEAFGRQETASGLAIRAVADNVAAEADYFGKKIKQQPSGAIGKVSKPSSSKDHHASQTAPHFIAAANDDSDGSEDGLSDDSDDSRGFDDSLDRDHNNYSDGYSRGRGGISGLYTAYKKDLCDDVAAMSDTKFSSQQAAMRREADDVKAENVQERAAHSTWENKLSGTIYRDQDAAWAKGILGVAAAMNSHTMHMAVHAANTFTEDAMRGVAGNAGASYFNALQKGDSTFSESANFLDANIATQTLGEVGAGVLGVGARFAEDVLPKVGRNWAGMFGRNAESLSENSRTIAAMHVREARNILRDVGLDAIGRNRILHSFNLETFRVEHITESRQIYRVFDDFNAEMPGRYTSEDLLENQTRRITDFALPSNSATRLATVDIPRNATVFTGRVSSQFGLNGGAQQTFLTGPLERYTFQETMMPREIFETRGMTNAY